MNGELLQTICSELSAERTLTAQVLNWLSGHHDVTPDALGDYFKRVRETTTVEIDGVEDYEIDVAFSPLFTPRLRDRARYAKLLDRVTVKHDEMETLVESIMDKNLEARFRHHDETFSMPLHEVLIRRYVRLLNLITPLSQNVKRVIEETVPENAQDIAKALARDPVWLPERRQEFLIAFLKVFNEKKNFSVDKLDYLTDFVRTYRPVAILDMEQMLANLIEACNEDIHKIEGGHYLYYHDLIERHYMGSDNEQQLSENLLQSKERHITMALELQKDFEAMSSLTT